MRLLVCGGRHFDDAVLVEGELQAFHAASPISVLIHGGLPGIGIPLESWARRNKVHVIRYPANFSLGKSGDATRDEFMLADSRAEMLLVFPGGRRTAELLREAGRKLVPVMLAQGIEPPVAREFQPDHVGQNTLPVDGKRQLLTV
mgnify:FL=1